MLDSLLPVLRTPRVGASPLHVLPTSPTTRRGDVIVEATLVGPNGEDQSQIDDGIWRAMGERGTPLTAAQLTNVYPNAFGYERLWRKGATGRFAGRPLPLDEELAEMRSALGGDVSGRRIVDIGCSEGMYARHLALWGAAAIAVDHSVPFLAAARRRATRLGVRIAPVRALAQHLPIVDAGLDAAVTGGTLNEIGDIDAALAEAARVVKPGGTLFCMSLIRATTGPGRALQAALRPTGIVFPTLDDTTRRIEQAGWTITETHVDRIVVRTTATRRTHDASE